MKRLLQLMEQGADNTKVMSLIAWAYTWKCISVLQVTLDKHVCQMGTCKCMCLV